MFIYPSDEWFQILQDSCKILNSWSQHKGILSRDGYPFYNLKERAGGGGGQ